MLIASSLKGTSIPKSYIFTLDKLIHIVEYFIFGALLYFSIVSIAKYSIILSLILGTFYSFIDELYQSTVYARNASGFDVIADIIGLILSALFVKLYFNSIGNDKEYKY
jgi:VanZ family protein